jgi:superfamily II DNA or RNA helicase
MKDTATLPLFDRIPFFATDPPKLRPYQSRAIQRLRDLIRSGKKRILLVLPTGSGKMVLIASIIRTSTVRVLFVCDSQELIEQCVNELAAVGITNVGVLRGDDYRENPDATVQIASIQTLARRVKPPAELILIDEAHLSASDSYQTHVFDHYKSAIIIGFTATPARLDGKPLGNSFECLEVVCGYQELIKAGFIVEPLCYTGPTELDLSTIQLIGGDYNETQLGDFMRNQALVGSLLEHWQKLANLYPRANGHPGLVEGPHRRTFIFAVNIAHSLDICARFESAGVRIAHLDAKTTDTERKRVIAAIGAGELDVITNVGILLKGVDVPSVKCVTHARPTCSLTLWRQSCGRILRPWHPGCRRGCTQHPSVIPMLIDHANNIQRLGFPHEDLHWSLTERAVSTTRREATRICRGCFAMLPAYKRLCPYCGKDAPPPDPSDIPAETEAKLQQLATSPEEMKRMYFDTIVRVARLKGHKPGFAAVRFKERYGAWPPWEWSQEVKASFASDPEWQEAYAIKAKKKQERELEKMAREQAKIEDPE